MRNLARLALPIVCAVGLAGGMLPASADHNADLHSPNLQLLDTEPGIPDLTTPNPTDVYTNSDLAFWGNRLYAGNYGGFRIFNLSNPANPTLITYYPCPSSQNDISVWNNDADPQADLLFLSVDGARVGATAGAFDPAVNPAGCTSTIAASSADTAQMEQAWEGVRIFDINDETAPAQIATVPTDCGSHTHTLVPTDDGVGAPAANTSLYIYVSSYPTSAHTNATDFADSAGEGPDGSDFGTADRVAGQRSNGTDCLEPEPRPDGEPGDWTAGQGHNKISIIEVNLSDPAAADDPVLESDGPPGPSCSGAADNCVVYPQVIETAMPLGTRVTHLASPGRTIEFTACHDISVFVALNLAAGSCWDEGILWDITNPEVPDFVRRIRLDAVDLLFHSVTFSWDGKVLAFEDEAGGGTDDRCRSSNDQQGRMWFTDPDLNVIGSFKIPRPQPIGENCTAHLYNFIPQTDDRDILVSAWYKGGISVADATQPAQTSEIGFYDAQGGAGTTDDADVWSSYWYNGYIYVNDIQRGVETLALNDARKENAVTLPFFNPQTQMNLIPQTRPSCRGRSATAWGTSQADTLVGTAGADVIAGQGGNDQITGMGANDVVCGGPGKDKIKGGSGRDKLFGEQQNDRLNGQAGRDTCNGGPGRDRGRSCERETSIP